ncbi:MAG: ABC transporter permease [Anaerolineae bacterium]
MITFLARRIIMVFAPTLLGISILVFVIMHLIPGSFVEVLVGVGTDITPEQLAAIERAYGLDKPLPVQYFLWLGNVLRGNLGNSLRTGLPVGSEILRRIPVTAELTLFALILALPLGISAGVVSAVRQNAWTDSLVRVGALLGLSVPNFLLATLLILLVSLYIPVFPTTGFIPLNQGLGDNLRSLFLPAFSLALSAMASIMRMTRSSMLEELRKEYVKVARSKGLKERLVILRHVLRNSLIPVVTVVGIWVGYLLGGTVIIEEIFALPGVGRLALNAIYQRDYPLVQGTVLFIAGVFVFVNLLTDLLYGLLDPRIRHTEMGS